MFHGLTRAGRPVVCIDARHIRGILKSFGIKLGIVTALNFPEKVLAAISTCDSVVQKTMRILHLTCRRIRVQENTLDKQCMRLAQADDACDAYRHRNV